jgi:hypothetical protein
MSFEKNFFADGYNEGANDEANKEADEEANEGSAGRALNFMKCCCFVSLGQ